ncbi:hypothetical protein PV392_27610 [Streptomyces sp. ME03-5709C]|nr:hypothetical protein [Streptomyces sp. ME03-5709C]
MSAAPLPAAEGAQHVAGAVGRDDADAAEDLAAAVDGRAVDDD